MSKRFGRDCREGFVANNMRFGRVRVASSRGDVGMCAGEWEKSTRKKRDRAREKIVCGRKWRTQREGMQRHARERRCDVCK
jgi:hypothetical protein